MMEGMMRRVVATEYVTLDGVMEDPGGIGKFATAGWHFPFLNEDTAQFKHDELFASDALLLGRVTYQEFAAAWPSRTDETGFADRMNSLPKYVASTTLTTAEWSNTTVIRGDIAEAVAALKQQPGQDILLSGSAELLRTLMRRDLIEEYRLLVHPVVVGSGKRLFGEGSETKRLRLVEAKAFSSGIVALTYQPERTA
jgi:dihydrofolate reductase